MGDLIEGLVVCLMPSTPSWMGRCMELSYSGDRKGDRPFRFVFIGGDLDVAGEFASWIVDWCAVNGFREDKRRFPAPSPLVEVNVYCPDESAELAFAVACLCECKWGMTGFAGIAHVSKDRIEALVDADLILDTTLSSSLDCGSSSRASFKKPVSIEEYQEAARMDAMMFAPRAQLIFLKKDDHLDEILPKSI